MRALDRPNAPGFTVESLLPRLEAFGSKAIIQTMLTRGTHDGAEIDNTTPAEIDALIEAYKRIRPAEIMLYTIDRRTPEQSLQRLSRQELDAAAARITARTGIPVQVSA